VTKALEDAFRAAASLPESQQDELAAAIKAEIEAEEEWERLFGKSQDALARLADEALSEHAAGDTRPLDPDDL